MALWFATRAFGIVSLALFSTVMVLGLLTAGRRPPVRRRSRPAFVITGLHRSLSLLALVLLGLHIATNVIDNYVTIRWRDAVIPFISDYRPFWLGLGAIACDIALVVIVTSLLRVRLGLRVWRAVHWLAYACWPIAVIHGIGVGTDRKLTLIVSAACLIAVASAAAGRIAATGGTAAAGRHSTPPPPAGGSPAGGPPDQGSLDRLLDGRPAAVPAGQRLPGRDPAAFPGSPQGRSRGHDDGTRRPW
ncbi:MAG TPA: ferric reductase-like transmembrane domain-containing protein [Streptosporangiaceae bacterium]